MQIPVLRPRREYQITLGLAENHHLGGPWQAFRDLPRVRRDGDSSSLRSGGLQVCHGIDKVDTWRRIMQIVDHFVQFPLAGRLRAVYVCFPEANGVVIR